MPVYYNEVDHAAAEWLRALIAAGLIAPGDVDERSIADVRPNDLAGYEQCHFFAGIGGWSHALRLAGWPDDRPVWTGSCPCQPFSAAGTGKAADDKRHLWPSWFSLIAERRPAIVFGEQVEAAIGWGWLDAVFADLEGEGYACGATVLPACGVGAPHIRARAWFVADSGHPPRCAEQWHEHGQRPEDGRALRLGYANGARSQGRREYAGEYAGQRSAWAAGALLSVADTEYSIGRPQHRPRQDDGNGQNVGWPKAHGELGACSPVRWADAEWLLCTDGKARPVEPGTFPLAHGIPGRVGRLRGYGNAIVPEVAAEFVRAFM